MLSFLFIGVLWDLEHLLAVGFGLALGPFLLGRRPVLTGARFSRHEWRMISFTSFLLAAAVRLLLCFVPSEGPLGATSADSSPVTAFVGAAMSVLLANGLRRDSHRAWLLAGALSTLSLLAGVILLRAELVAPDELAAGSGVVISSVPELILDIVLWGLQILVLVLGRAAFGARARRRGSRAPSPR